MTSQIYIANLPPNLTELDLRKILQEFGRVRELTIRWPAESHRFAFATMRDPREALQVIAGLDQHELLGYTLSVSLAEHQHPKPDTVSVYMNNFSYDATEQDLSKLFADCGVQVEHIQLMRNAKGQSLGFGFYQGCEPG